MPAVSISFEASWAVYLAASLALIPMFMPMMTEIQNDSIASAAMRTLSGVKQILDSLRPGMRVTLSLKGAFDTNGIRLAGHQILEGWTRSAPSVQCGWNLPNATLLPSGIYTVWLEGASVKVASDVRS